jgi:hypothetical protein
LLVSVFVFVQAIITLQDDIFAVLVEMPLAHKIACFRDDAVFVLYLLQLNVYSANGGGSNVSNKRDHEAKKQKAQ